MINIGFNLTLLWGVACLVFIQVVEARRRSVWAETSFEGNSNAVTTRISEYGEKETRVNLNGIRAMETTEPHRGEDFPFVKEAVKNNRLVWLVYKDRNHIIDCNITRDTHNVDKFLRKFNNGTPVDFQEEFHKHGKERESGNHDFLDFGDLLKECRQFKKNIREFRKEYEHEKHHHKTHKKHKHNKHHKHDSRPEEEDEESDAKSRSKRSVFSMIYPGTKWCGSGNKASGGYDDLGENVATDKCCRQHDHCPYTISGFSNDYNYFNYKFHTLSHCNCEERFKSCLKSAGNSVANMIGYLYFNYVGTNCFNLKPKKVCKKRTWWGKCKRYKTKFSARVLDSQLKF